MSYYRPQFVGRGGMMPPVVKALLILNVGVFFLTYFLTGAIAGYLGLVPKLVWSKLMIWQLFTYMFLHGGFWHILMNMFILWMFGSDLERAWGSREFLKYYIICGVGAGLFNVLLEPNSTIAIIGASGAIYGILVAFALMFPNRLVYLYFLFPIKVKYLVIFLAVMTLFLSMQGGRGNIAHLAHLGGLLVGYLYLKMNLQDKSLKSKFSQFMYRQKMEKAARNYQKEQKLMEEVDRILDKINKVGYDKLTRQEKKTLEDASDKLSEK